ncbi:hypothetical protein HanIR_Chr04g0186061 [Helianthus annuus]|nr:hypothetical protein HanIR_Chr04g0186061 [Helianthus annuus]
MVYQMARRGDEYFLARRVADRGNDMSVFYSRACGEDRHPTRRVADRGSDGVYLDPRDFKINRLRQRIRDFEEIKRLRQRVRDLEEIGRLRQRVRDLELQRERRVMGTESLHIIRDDVNEEENPFGRYPPRFYEPIYQENLSEEEPRFDEDGIEPGEEECLWVLKALSSLTIQEDEPISIEYLNENAVAKGSATMATGGKSVARDESDGEEELRDDSMKSAVVRDKPIVVDSFKRKSTVAGGDTVVGGGVGAASVEESHNVVARGGVALNLEVQVLPPSNPGKLNFELHTVLSPKNPRFQIGSDFKIIDKKISVAFDKKIIYSNGCKPPMHMHENITRGPIKPIEKFSENMIRHVGVEQHLNYCGSHVNIPSELSNLPIRESNRLMVNIISPIKTNGGPTFGVDTSFLEMVEKVKIYNGLFSHSPKEKPSGKTRIDPIYQPNFVGGSIKFCQSIQLHTPFDPGGTGSEQGELIHKVKLFKGVMMIIIKQNRIDVPFDPGGLVRRQNSRTSFF